MNRTALVLLAASAAAIASCRGHRGAPAAAGPNGATTPAAPAPPPTVDASALDRSVDPCDDFYRFACGGWLARTEIPADKPAWSRGFAEVNERNQLLLRRILHEHAAGRAHRDDRFADKTGDYWAACMDEAAVEERGLAELRAEWTHLDAVEDPATLARELGRLHARGVFALFGFASDQDARDATETIGVVYQDGLGLPDRDYYLREDAKTVEIREAYRAHVRTMLELAGAPAAAAAREADAIVALETTLAESHWTLTELRDPERRYNRVELAGLEKAAPTFPWRRWLAAVGRDGVPPLSVTTPRMIERVGELVVKTPAATWRSYLRWHLLNEAARARTLPRAFVEQDFAFRSRAFSGARALEPRWKRCVREVDEALGEAVGQAFVRRHFGAEGKEDTLRLVRGVEQAMDGAIRRVPWMDARTREEALKKLGRVWNKIGYPEQWRDYGPLEVERGSYFRSWLAARAFEVERDLDKIGKPLDRKEWLMSPPTVNAYYNPALNEMVFPAGILQPPFYARAAPDALNHGAIGMVVAHELTHGFDDEGRQYDAEGNLRDWWSAEVSREFDRRAECLVEQYGGYEAVDGLKLDGKLTLGENIADLGGVKLAWAAWQASPRRAEARPEGGFTPEQQFFLGFAQSWCQSEREPYARMLAQLDSHSPPRWRVNGPLANVPEFGAAFACPAGSAMVRPPERRCAVW